MFRQIVTDDDELTVVDGLMHLLDMSLCVYQEVVGSQQFHHYQSIKRRIVVVVLVFAAATATSTMDGRGGEKSQDSNSSNS